MLRWKVVRGKVLWRKQLFLAGDLMPVTFTAADRNTHVYGRRLAQVEVPDEPVPSPSGGTKPAAPKVAAAKSATKA